jgi:hypothetical protein
MTTTGSPTLEVLRGAARGLAQSGAADATLRAMLQPLVDRLGIASAAVFVVSSGAELELTTSIGVGDPAALAGAVRNPEHPVARTAVDRRSGYDVVPIAAGGPALRAHLPLMVGVGDQATLVGVLALAYDEPLDSEKLELVTTLADLAAVAVARTERFVVRG